MGSELPKQLLSVAGKPLLYYSLRTFERCAQIDTVVVVVPEGYEDLVKRDIVGSYRLDKVSRIVSGGEQRHHSVAYGLRALPPDTRRVAIHDGARPFISSQLLISLLDAAQHHDAVVPCVALKDTIKRISGETVAETVDRTDLVAVQTPQLFIKQKLEAAMEKAAAYSAYLTDDAAFFEKCGMAVYVVQGDPLNLKITTPEDLAFAEFILKSGKWNFE